MHHAPMFKITLECQQLHQYSWICFVKKDDCAFSGLSYIYCTASDCIDNPWERN